MVTSKPCVSKVKRRPYVLLVLQPEARQAFNTTQMAYSVCPYQIAYFAKNEWAETPSEMLKNLLLQTLHRTGRFKAVVSPPFAGRYDYVLSVQILKFLQNYTVCPPQFELVFRTQIIKLLSNRVLSSREVYISEPITKIGPYCGVLAANRAVSRAVRKITISTVKTIR